MGYSEFYCHLCGVSFNIVFRLKSGELDVPGPENQKTDGFDFTDNEDTSQDLDYKSQKDCEEEPYEYDSDCESTDGMSLGGDMSNNEDCEDNSTDDSDGQTYYNWVLQTFNPASATRGESQQSVGYFDSPMSGYSSDAISPEEARGCRTAQFLVRKTDPRDQWRADQLHAAWEIDGDWSLSGICDGTPSRDISCPIVCPVRNGIDYVEADNVNFDPDREPDDIAMPFHPWCFDIFCRQSKVQFQRINVEGLMTWRNAEFGWDDFGTFPRAKEVNDSQDQWWCHDDGTEYLVANPLYVPGLPEILLTAAKNERLPSSSDPYSEIESSQPVANRPTASHKRQTDSLSSLPAEIRLIVIEYLDSSDITSLSIASRAFAQLPNSVWYKLVRKEMPWLWEAWEESECIHNPSPWTILTTADIKCVVTARSAYAQALVEDSYTQLDAEKAAESRFVLPIIIPEEVKLPRATTDWHRVFMQIRLNWDKLKGLRNRQRIWVDVEEVVRRIQKFDP